jgi:hypothetical protein
MATQTEEVCLFGNIAYLQETASEQNDLWDDDTAAMREALGVGVCKMWTDVDVPELTSEL